MATKKTDSPAKKQPAGADFEKLATDIARAALYGPFEELKRLAAELELATGKPIAKPGPEVATEKRKAK